MRRRIKITLLAIGAIAGFASGFSSLHCRAEARRQVFERHVASRCVEAARQAERSSWRSAAPARPEPLQADTCACR